MQGVKKVQMSRFDGTKINCILHSHIQIGKKESQTIEKETVSCSQPITHGTLEVATITSQPFVFLAKYSSDAKDQLKKKHR